MAKKDQSGWLSQQKSGNGGSSHLLSTIHHDIDQIFENFWSGFQSPLTLTRQQASTMLMPNINFAETDKSYLINAELPGIDSKDVIVEIEDGNLILKGEKKVEKEEEKKHYHRIECSYGSFHRIIGLPADADENSISAKFDKGVLRIDIRKQKGKVEKKRSISIES